jgi:hypothetical protein
MKIPLLYAALKRKREFERLEMPFMGSLLDFDIIIEIGFAQEQGWHMTPKKLLLLKLSSDRTVRRKLGNLVAHHVILGRRNAKDHRSEVLTLSPKSARVLEKYGRMLLSLGDVPDSSGARGRSGA